MGLRDYRCEGDRMRETERQIVARLERVWRKYHPDTKPLPTEKPEDAPF